MADDLDAVLDDPVARVPLGVLIKERQKYQAEKARVAELMEEQRHLEAQIMAALDAEEKALAQRKAEAEAREREVLARPTSAHNRVAQAIANGLWPPPSIAPRR